jgi:hypothetical protein
MTWARLDDGFPQHPKVIGLSDAAFRLHVSAVCYCARNLTDGAIPKAALKVLGGSARHVAELHTAGLWEAAGNGFTVHDYLDYNPSAKQIDSKRKAKSVAGAKGASSRWHGKPHANGNAPDPDPSQIPNSPSSHARSARQWWEHVTGKPLEDRALRQQLDDIQATHGFECVAWGFTQAIGKDDPWPYVKRIFDSCILGGEGHGPRVKERRNGVAKTQQSYGRRVRDGFTH